MTVYLNLPPVREALRREIRGNTAHLYGKDIASIPVPTFSDDHVKQVTGAFTEAYAAERKAQAELAAAVAAVEGFVTGS